MIRLLGLLLLLSWAPNPARANYQLVPAIVAVQESGEVVEEFESEEMSEFARLGTYVLVIIAIGLVAWLLSS